MDFIRSSFAINKDVNDGIAVFVAIIGMIACIATISVSIPQLVYLLKRKKTGEVKFYSFWIFFAALCSWIIFGSFTGEEAKMAAVVYANILCAYVYCVLLFFMYKYDEKVKRNKRKFVVLGITLTLTTICAIVGFVGLYHKNSEGNGLNFDPNTTAILSQIIPVISTFAFLPQVLKTFEKRDIEGLSVGLILMFVLTNIFWIAYWVSLIIAEGKLTPALTSTLLWQTLSLLIYISQLSMMLHILKTTKKAMQEAKNNQENSTPQNDQNNYKTEVNENVQE
ncbi:PQ-loop domain-containing transporter [Mycoplasmopsis fermentans]|uniref:PQ-loop domain-containing transporter n=1 Tax=Mycoplasmopsis fermentans TaxID=2115 RepID=UPI000F015935|nr:PQ-loop domain-containing transporter [Mycoplasmopsis fermentans]RMX36048.1 sugar efflux transporter for intercellular exchange family protein [Mycoplasmopsis fermentans MF-I2]